MLAECWLIFWLHRMWVTPAAEFMSAAGMPCLVDDTHSPLPVLQPVHSFSSILSVPQPSFGGLGGSWTQMSPLGRDTCPALLSTPPTSESAHSLLPTAGSLLSDQGRGSTDRGDKQKTVFLECANTRYFIVFIELI